MKIVEISEVQQQISKSLDFTLSHLISDFDYTKPEHVNISAFSKVSLSEILTHDSIPYVSGSINGIKIPKTRVYSFINQDFFETAPMELSERMIKQMAFYFDLANRSMINLRKNIESEFKRMANITSGEQLPDEIIKILNQDLTVVPSEFARSIVGSFVRLYFMRKEGAYSDVFYQGVDLQFKIMFNNDNDVEIIKLN